MKRDEEVIIVNRRERSREGSWPERVKTVWLRYIWSANTSLVRLLLIISSLFWAIIASYDLSTGSYSFLTHIIKESWFWVSLFLLHSIGLIWRLFDPVIRVPAGLVVNSYGVLIWFFVTIGATTKVGFYPTFAADYTICLLAAWVLYRTGTSGSTES